MSRLDDVLASLFCDRCGRALSPDAEPSCTCRFILFAGVSK